MKKSSIISFIVMIVTAMMLSGCILPPFPDGDGGGHRDHGRGGEHRGGGEGHRDGGEHH